MSTKPWEPAPLLTVVDKYKRSGFNLRWVREDRLAQALAEGYVTVQGKQEDISPNTRLIDGTQIGKTIRTGHLILCEIPKELDASRTQYYDKLNKENIGGIATSYEEDINKEGVANAAYGNVKLTVKQEGVPSK